MLVCVAVWMLLLWVWFVGRHSPGKRGILLRKGEQLREESQAPPSSSAARQEDQLLLLESRTVA